jgi:hypothetical protein
MAKLDKTFKHENIHYRYDRTLRKWVFESKRYTLAQACGGHTIARQVAAQFQGGLRRSNWTGIDNLARLRIKQLTGF